MEKFQHSFRVHEFCSYTNSSYIYMRNIYIYIYIYIYTHTHTYIYFNIAVSHYGRFCPLQGHEENIGQARPWGPIHGEVTRKKPER